MPGRLALEVTSTEACFVLWTANFYSAHLEIGSPIHLSVATTWIYIQGFVISSLLFIRASGVRLSDELLLATLPLSVPLLNRHD